MNITPAKTITLGPEKVYIQFAGQPISVVGGEMKQNNSLILKTFASASNGGHIETQPAKQLNLDMPTAPSATDTPEQAKAKAVVIAFNSGLEKLIQEAVAALG